MEVGDTLFDDDLGAAREQGDDGVGQALDVFFHGMSLYPAPSSSCRRMRMLTADGALQRRDGFGMGDRLQAQGQQSADGGDVVLDAMVDLLEQDLLFCQLPLNFSISVHVPNFIIAPCSSSNGTPRMSHHL
ncbi:MAG: hypothetical protein MZV63_33480 [Marinilabiliales bacterium]|nr:hypothetical protein [Marinilabiliales bacterium]